jgi:hypothetical protein
VGLEGDDSGGGDGVGDDKDAGGPMFESGEEGGDDRGNNKDVGAPTFESREVSGEELGGSDDVLPGEGDGEESVGAVLKLGDAGADELERSATVFFDG